MKFVILGAALLAALMAPVCAETRHDRKIDEAAARIVAAKMGDLRGGFDYNVETTRILLPDLDQTGSIPVPDKPAVADAASASQLRPMTAAEQRPVRIIY